MRASWFALISLALNTYLPASAIDTVPTLDVEKYIGRWYQVREVGQQWKVVISANDIFVCLVASK